MGLRLSQEKTVIVHIDEGLDFLGMHIQRHKKLGAPKRYVYTYPSRVALASVKAKVRSATRGTTNQSLSELVNRLNPVLRGWTNYHRHGASSKTFPTCRLSLGGGCGSGCGINTPMRQSRNCDAAISRDGGRHRTRSGCSNPTRSPSCATATGERPSPRHGRRTSQLRSTTAWTCGEPGAWKRARRVVCPERGYVEDGFGLLRFPC